MPKCYFNKVTNGPEIGPEIRFFAIFSSLVHSFSFKLHRMITWNNV